MRCSELIEWAAKKEIEQIRYREQYAENKVHDMWLMGEEAES